MGRSIGCGSAALVPLFALVFACQTQETSPAADDYPQPAVRGEGPLVAEVGPVRLTAIELSQRLREQTPFARLQLREPEKRRKFLEGEIQLELLAQEAWRRGLHRDPKVVAELKRIVVQKLIAQELDAAGSLEVAEAELTAAYQARNAEFNKPERVRLSQIVRYVDDESERRAAKRLLESVKAKVVAAQKQNDQLAFGAAAREHSEDEATRNGGGDLNFLTREELGERYGTEVARHVFEEVTIGDLALADAPNAVVLFKKTGLRRGTQQALEQVKPQLRAQLVAEKRAKLYEALVARLMTERGASIDEAALERIELPSDETAPTTAPVKSVAPGPGTAADGPR